MTNGRHYEAVQYSNNSTEDTSHHGFRASSYLYVQMMKLNISNRVFLLIILIHYNTSCKAAFPSQQHSLRSVVNAAYHAPHTSQPKSSIYPIHWFLFPVSAISLCISFFFFISLFSHSIFLFFFLFKNVSCVSSSHSSYITSRYMTLRSARFLLQSLSRI